MDRRSVLAFSAASVLIAPAVLVLAAGALDTVGIPATRLVNAAFGALGVSNGSPLPVRQAWYAGTFILAPLAGAAVALTACIEAGARARWQLGALCACAALIASFWTIHSLLDA